MNKIFISYRRSANESYSRSLYNKLANEFGENNVFIDSLLPSSSQTTKSTVEQKITSCKVMLVLIDPYWAEGDAEYPNNGLRYFDELTSFEIETALKQEIEIIPLLFNDAVLPKAESLSKNIIGLTEKIACRIRHNQHYAGDIENVVNLVSEHRHAKTKGRFQKLDAQGCCLANSSKNWAAVFDHKTQLTWEIKSKNGDLHDREQIFTWQEGYNYINRVNQEAFCGHSDWRMPTVEELKTLIDPSQMDDWKIDHHYFDDQPSAQTQWFWTQSGDKHDIERSWAVLFSRGDAYCNRQAYQDHIRLVRCA